VAGSQWCSCNMTRLCSANKVGRALTGDTEQVGMERVCGGVENVKYRSMMVMMQLRINQSLTCSLTHAVAL
jgi:hypothetical protein